MLNKALELSIDQALKYAEDKQHEFMTVDHLLLALLNNAQVVTALRSFNLDIEQLRVRIATYLETTIPVVLVKRSEYETRPTLGVQRAIQRAMFQAQSAGLKEVTGINLLLALFSEKDCYGITLLREMRVSRLDVSNYLFSMSRPQTAVDESRLDSFSDNKEEISESDASARYLTNLNQLALQGKIDPVIGREQEIERAIQILCRRRKNNPLYVGEAGVGKTALAGCLAQRITCGQVPTELQHKTIFALDIGALLAGTKYRGDFEQRFNQVLNQLKRSKGAILFIDEIHTIMGAGSTNSGSLDMANLLKPLLASGEISCIGSTTFQEYRAVFEKDHALARRFQKIEVSEPSVEQTVKILSGLKKTFEEYHHVKYTKAALVAAAELSARYINDRHLPDKAIDIIDEVGAAKHLQHTSKRKAMIDVVDIEKVVSKMAGIPARNVSTSDRDVLRNIERNLKMLIYGQDTAIETLATAIKLARSGLRADHKPVGSFLFAGPTGVGKTEVAKQLALCLGISLLRFDMSEYMEPHTVSRLLGAPPGYVGFDQHGLLTEAVHKNPYCVLLLDEIEKAHPDIFNLLLQVMDNGALTDSHGRQVDFRHAIIIMTTNAGAADINRSTIGFIAQHHASDGIQAINRLFSPEFRNRLDAIVQFNALDKSTILNVVDKFMLELEHQLHEKNVRIEVSAEVKDWLVIHGYDQQMGARPMARLIQERIKKPLADELLFGRLTQGGTVIVNQIGDQLSFEVQLSNLPLPDEATTDQP